MRGWAEDLEQKAERYQDLHARMTGLSATASSELVSVSVDSDGVPTDLRLTDRARGADPATISAELMACMRRAQVSLRQQVTELVHDAVGEDTAGEHIIGGYVRRFPGETDTETLDHAAPLDNSPRPDDEDDEFYQRKSWLT
ncbi:hypothetical protein NRB20_38040 [Nocardia sp. RB20]|uniref:YbaB/EbfC DNA-binding family protein n=2 Tax=Nocardia macrotermitis TaxID=2585198 RepID=A0A7K0D4M8_9NOCA|nr:hypothetical protein [Nocardia macrotermitis]